jgi:flagellar basal-body rod protein FlgG
MATIALHSAATGLSALSTQLDVISNNLANANTTGFKSFRTNLEDLMYQEKKQPGVENANGDARPTGLYVGLGVRVAGTQNMQSTGSPINTNGELDLMIDGAGYFMVDIPQNMGDGVGYTRAGNLTLNRDGELVLGNAGGPRVLPNITIPANAQSISIAYDGTVNVFLPDQVEPQNVGQLTLANFINPNGLKPLGGTIFVETAASGPAIENVPGENNAGQILQGFIESSNVDPVVELVNLIKTQRSFEMNSQSIQAADQTLQVISNLRR